MSIFLKKTKNKQNERASFVEFVPDNLKENGRPCKSAIFTISY